MEAKHFLVKECENSALMNICTIILQELLHDVHFWIGKYSSQDEYGTAAYKTVELDTFVSMKFLFVNQQKRYTKDDNPVVVWRSCSFYYDPLRHQLLCSARCDAHIDTLSRNGSNESPFKIDLKVINSELLISLRFNSRKIMAKTTVDFSIIRTSKTEKLLFKL